MDGVDLGPYIYRFDRASGLRTGGFTLPDKFAVDHLDPVGQTEIDNHTVGRVANKGMEGLAITRDGSDFLPTFNDQPNPNQFFVFPR